MCVCGALYVNSMCVCSRERECVCVCVCVVERVCVCVCVCGALYVFTTMYFGGSRTNTL